MSSTARTIMNTLAKGDLRLNWFGRRDRALFRPLILRKRGENYFRNFRMITGRDQ